MFCMQHSYPERHISFTYGQQTVSCAVVTSHASFASLDYFIPVCTVEAHAMNLELNSHHVGVASMVLAYGKRSVLLVFC